MTPPPTKSVLITGCSAGGAGAALAHSFQKRNYLVIATTRNPSKIPSSLTSLPNVVTVALDVTSDSSVEAAAESVKKTLADSNIKGLNVLINNAGLGWWAPLLDLPMKDAKAIFETNFFGVIRVTQAFARELVDAKGTLVNVSSVSGEPASREPFKSMYSASKAALTQASETWRLEFEPLGVRVITVAMGLVKSEFFSAYEADVKLLENSYYTPIKPMLDKMMKPEPSVLQISTEAYAERVVKYIENGKAGKIWVGGITSIVRYVAWMLPGWFLDYLLRKRTPGAFPILRESRKGL